MAAHGEEDDESLRAPAGPAVHGLSAEQLAALRARRDRALAPEAARIGATEVRW